VQSLGGRRYRVIATDICERTGLKVPPFSRETQAKLLQIRPDAGANIRNPVEPKLGMEGAADFYLKGLPIIDQDTKTDIILIQMAIDVYGGHTPDLVQNVTEAAYALSAVADSIKKPILVALFTGATLTPRKQRQLPGIYSQKQALQSFRV